jgi:hypothetical protein
LVGNRVNIDKGGRELEKAGQDSRVEKKGKENLFRAGSASPTG